MKGGFHGEQVSGAWTPGRAQALGREASGIGRQRKARRRAASHVENPELLPINRSHTGSAGVTRMRRQGFSEERIREAVKDWLLKPIPRHDRLNGYARFLDLGRYGSAKYRRRLIHYLTPEQIAKAESIYRKICFDHREALAQHPKRAGVYWACAVSRVRAKMSYRQQRRLRNAIKSTYNKLFDLMPPRGITDPVKRLEHQNFEANKSLHALLDRCEESFA